jgi:HAD superfamily hydrolase (TIGR01509 family)
MIRGLFFDLDGTLVDTYEADFLAYRDAIAEVAGKIIDKAGFDRMHGKEMAEKLAALVPELSKERYPDVRAAKKKHYKKYVHITQLNDVLLKFAEQFKGHHHCVLVTTAKRDNVQSVLSHHGLLDFFTDLICGDDVSHAKPHPESYELALKKTGLKPHEAVAFEDSESGIASAEAAGIPVIRVKEFSAA